MSSLPPRSQMISNHSKLLPTAASILSVSARIAIPNLGQGALCTADFSMIDFGAGLYAEPPVLVDLFKDPELLTGLCSARTGVPASLVVF